MGGALRAVAQTVSYEVCLALILMFYLCLVGRIRIIMIMARNRVWNKIIILLPIVGIWLISCLAETNRTPFDFAEGESELVSGFNIEYGAAGFALIFLAEYANILVIRLFTAIIFFGGNMLIIDLEIIIIIKVLFFAFLFIWVRGSYPRFRYDLLISLT